MEKTSPTILLAEDSEDDAFFFQRSFRKAGSNCTLVHAPNGKVAIDTLSQAPNQAALPLLMFLDLKMPVLNGFEVLEWLQSAKLNGKVKVIVLSGSNDQSDQKRAFGLGAADYLVKPITPETLKAKIAQEIKNDEARTEAQT